jgi:Flp pilus assembly protein TadG
MRSTASRAADRRVSRSSRRGANAVEFALVSPILIALLMAAVDYGYFYLRESLVENALRDAVRYGSVQSPSSSDLTGHCTPCTSGAATVAQTELANLGITVTTAQVTPTIITITASGTNTCGLKLSPSPTITHSSLVGWVPVPSNYNLKVTMFMHNTTGC